MELSSPDQPKPKPQRQPSNIHHSHRLTLTTIHHHSVVHPNPNTDVERISPSVPRPHPRLNSCRSIGRAATFFVVLGYRYPSDSLAQLMFTLLFLFFLAARHLYQIEHRHIALAINIFLIVTIIFFRLYNEKKIESVLQSQYVLQTRQEITSTNSRPIDEQ